MAKPPPTPPSSDLEGVNRDARVNAPNRAAHPDPGGAIKQAQDESKGQPDQGEVAG